MPDAGTAFDGSIWVASTSAVALGECLQLLCVTTFPCWPHQFLPCATPKGSPRNSFTHICFLCSSPLRLASSRSERYRHAVGASAAVTALGASLVAVGLSRLEGEESAMLTDDASELEAAAAAKQGSPESAGGTDKPQQGRERIKKS